MPRRVRRAHHVFLYLKDAQLPDVGSLLRGRVELSPSPRALALSIVTGDELALSPDELELLRRVPESRWTELEPADEAPAARLLEAGLLVAEDADGVLAELCRRDEAVAADQWSAYAALYHFMTKWRDVRVELQPDPGAVEELLRRQGPPPPAFHTPPDAPPAVQLPVELPDGPLADVLRRRKTTRAFDPDASLSLAQLSAILYATFGCHGVARLGEDVVLLRKTSPSGGAMHAVEAYPLLVRVEGLEPGLYHYAGESHGLRPVRPLAADEARALVEELTAGQAYFASAQALFLLTARFRRSYWKYRHHARAYAVLLMDAAHLSQTLYLVCAELRLGAFVTAAVNGHNIERALGLDGFAEGALAIAGCGVPARDAAGLEPEFEPYVPGRTR